MSAPRYRAETQSSNPSEGLTAGQRLEQQIDELLQKGLISQQEYDTKKAEILCLVIPQVPQSLSRPLRVCPLGFWADTAALGQRMKMTRKGSGPSVTRLVGPATLQNRLPARGISGDLWGQLWGQLLSGSGSKPCNVNPTPSASLTAVRTGHMVDGSYLRHR